MMAENDTQQVPFNFFAASWQNERVLPESWYREHKYRKTKFYAFFWAPQLFTDDPDTFERNRNNAESLMELISTLNSYNLKEYDFVPFITTGDFTRQDALEELEKITELQKGDCCLFYYCGDGIQDIKLRAEDRFVAEPVFTGDQFTDGSMRSLRDKLRDLTRGKGVHVFMIMDYKSLIPGAIKIPIFNNDLESTYIVLESPTSFAGAPGTGTSPGPLTDNFFFEELADVIRTTGAKMRYSNLLSLLQLRYLQAGLQEKPRLFALPQATSNAYIFSGVFSGKSDYRLYFDEESKEWRINAGVLNGILPSLGFMHTQFQLDDGRMVSILDTFESYSTLLNFNEPDTENTFTARLVQNALPKMKVGFDANIAARMRNQFEQVKADYGLYFIDMVDDAEQSNFLIKNRGDEFYLVRNGAYMGSMDDRPLFFYQRDTKEFIKQLEYIAQWQALLELENARSAVSAENVDTGFELIEGIGTGDLKSIDALPAVQVTNPSSLVVHYRNQQAPLLRCFVSAKEGTENINYHVNFLYLDSCFGIMKIECYNSSSEILHSHEKIWAALRGVGETQKYKTMTLTLESFYISENIFEIQDYLLVILSAEPLDVTPLTQDFLKPYQKEVSRSQELGESSKQSFMLPAGDWFVKKIPIKLMYDVRTFAETVHQTIQKRAIVTYGDSHKNRWGGKSFKDGFELSTVVEPISGSGYFNVTLKVRHRELVLDNGDVAFLLHESFNDPVQFTTFKNGEASLRVQAYEDFTAAAILYDGTELELDLSEVPGLPKKFYAIQPKDKFKKEIEELVARTPVVVKDDQHKNRWGGKPAQNGYELNAYVTQSWLPAWFKVTLEVRRSNTSPEQQVAFLLHDSFNKPVRIRSFENDIASVTVTAYEDFTAAAIIDDGSRTQLELDLSQVTGLPKGFYSTCPPSDFTKKVEKILDKTPVVVPDDLQKNRWGGLSEINGKKLSAAVTRVKGDYHQVTFVVESTTGTPLSGKVAFFLHDSFENATLYREAVDGKASCLVSSYEAFTVGAYTEDETMLELDLNKVQGFPEEFYYG